MAGIRALQKRASKLEKAAMPTPSLIALWYGSFDAWVEREVLPGVESGALSADDMVELVAALRTWEQTGHGAAHMHADGARIGLRGALFGCPRRGSADGPSLIEHPQQRG